MRPSPKITAYSMYTRTVCKGYLCFAKLQKRARAREQQRIASGSADKNVRRENTCQFKWTGFTAHRLGSEFEFCFSQFSGVVVIDGNCRTIYPLGPWICDTATGGLLHNILRMQMFGDLPCRVLDNKSLYIPWTYSCNLPC